ncbi:MAG: redoxin domain-containing protein [Dehalococcoidia bacterium]|jgi:peroxiredoxin
MRAAILLSVAAVFLLGIIAGGITGWCLAEGNGSSSVPGLINYQGTLTNPATGNPVPNNQYQMTFSIYSSDTGGSALWQETQQVTVQNGVFNVLLGSQNALNESIFEGSTRYLGVKVGTDNEMTPRQRLTTVPYAFQAENAQTLQGLSADSFIRAPAVAPVISGITVSSISSSSAVISWTTNVGTNTVIFYGTTTSFDESAGQQLLLVTSHSITLTSLNANTTYYYRIKAEDIYGNVATSSVATFTTTTGPIPPTVNGIYINYDYRFSVHYPETWTSQTVTLSGGVFYAKDDDLVYIAVRPATNFADAATSFLTDLIASSGAAFSPSVESETTITLDDGTTQANQIVFSAAFGMAKAVVTGVLKDGNAIMVCGASDPQHLDLYKAIGQSLFFWTAGPYIGDMAPDFTLRCIDGSQVTLSNLRGKKVIINFWNLNCHFSMEEMPDFQTVRDNHPESSVAMLIINSAAAGFPANSDLAVGAAVATGGWTFTVPLDDSGAVAQAYDVTSGIPVTFFIDSGGIIRAKQDGKFSDAAAIEAMLSSY